MYKVATKSPKSLRLTTRTMSCYDVAVARWQVTTIECKPCDKGFFRPATSPVWRCLQAPFGSFQNETGQAVVKRCKERACFFSHGPRGIQTKSVP